MADIDSLREPLRSIIKKIIEESGGRVTIVSGYRSHDEQTALYNNYISGKGNLAAKPGSSLHEHGMAVDFGGDLTLAAQLAEKYGLHASVPGEPWHYTLGEGQGFDGDPDFSNIEYDLGGSQNPQDVLANRLHSVLRILGQDLDGTASPYTHVSSPDTDVMTEPGTAAAPNSSALAGAAAGQIASGKAGELQNYARSLFSTYGFTDADLPALIELWNKESNWNPNAANPHSSARGIAQKMTSIHGPVEPTAQGQIQWGLQYIRDRYGSPSNALAFHRRNNWY